jgi:hypothetical protein
MRAFLGAMFAMIGFCAAAAASPDPHAEPPLPALPSGSLQLFSGNQEAANFIVLDQTKQIGTVVDAWLFSVPYEPYSFRKDRTRKNTIVQVMDHLTFDCAKRDFFVLLSDSAFNADGERLVWLPRDDPKPITPRSRVYFLAQVVCDHHPLPPSNTVIGHEAAIIAAHRAVRAAVP